MRYAIAVKTNIYNFKSSLKNKSFLQTYVFISYTLCSTVYWESSTDCFLTRISFWKGACDSRVSILPTYPEIPLDVPTNF